MTKKRIIIIGGGLSGLSSAINLAANGHHITIVEQNKRVGGQIDRIYHHGCAFNLGTYPLLMPETLQDLFATVHKNMDDYITLRRMEPQWRNFFTDGVTVDFTQSLSDIYQQLGKAYDPEKLDEYLNLLHQIHETTSKNINVDLSSFSFWKQIRHFFQSKPKQSLVEIHNEFIDEPHIEQILNYFPIMDGFASEQSSLALDLYKIYNYLHCDLYEIEGGFYQLIEALVQLLYELGVEIRTETKVTRILTECFEVVGVELENGTQLPANLIVSSVDPLTTYQKLLSHFTRTPKWLNQLGSVEPSLSTHILLLQVNKIYKQLTQHNYFYSKYPDREVRDLFEKKEPAEDPTIYVGNQGQNEQQQHLIIISQVPALKKGETWEAYRKPFYQAYRRRVINKLEKMGLDQLERNILWEKEITPDEHNEKLGSFGGCIYGIRSQSQKPFLLSKLWKAGGIYDLYFVGNSVSYDSSLPMLLLTSKKITEQIKKEIVTR